MRAPRGIPVLAVLALGLGLAGCNLFQPRTAPPPTQAGVPTNYTEADSTLATLALAIEAKGGSNSLSAYIRGLADSVTASDTQDFLAFFDPVVAKSWQDAGHSVPAIWNRAVEQRMVSFLSSLSTNRYDFSWNIDVQHPNDEVIDANTKVLHRQYVLVGHPAGAAPPDTLAIGYADLTFINPQGTTHWVISRWQDHVDPAVGANPVSGKQSFSALRLENSGQ